MEPMVTVILAAGKGTRMKSELVKVLHPVAGRPMLAYPVAAARAVGSQRIIVVAGYQKDKVEAALQGQQVDIALQAEQLGSGHAVLMAAPHLAGFAGDVLILCGDVPLVTTATLEAFLGAHRENQACVSVLTVDLDDPAGYGRILRTRQPAVRHCRAPRRNRRAARCPRNKHGHLLLPGAVSV